MHVGWGTDKRQTETPKKVADESGMMGVINLDWDLNTMWESKPFYSISILSKIFSGVSPKKRRNSAFIIF